MNATERSALYQGAVLFDEMYAAVDERTLEILDRRRRTATIRRRGWLVRRMLLVADLVGLAIAFLVAEAASGGGAFAGHMKPDAETLVFIATLPVWVVVAKLYGLYDNDEERTDHSTVDDAVPVFHLVTVGTWLLFVIGWSTGVVDPQVPKLLTFWALAAVGIPLARAASRAYCRRQITYLQNAVIVGAGEVGQLVAHKYLHHREYGINLVGFVDADPLEAREDVVTVPVLGAPERLPAIVRLFDIERVVFAFSGEANEDTLALIRSVKDLDVQIDIVPRLFEILGPNARMHTVEGVPLVGLPPLRLSMSTRFLKRAMDVAIAASALLALAPLFLFLATWIKLSSRGPVFFRQVRMGAANEPFRIFKFRTMIADAEQLKDAVAHLNMHLGPAGDARMFKVPNDPRVTKVGRFLRRYSFDELPQLLNVLRGDMSLVGPRPLILEEDRHVADWARQRLNLKPGITGPWQVLGGSEIPFDEMVKLDYLYVTGWSLLTDLKLVLRTVPAVVRHREAY